MIAVLDVVACWCTTHYHSCVIIKVCFISRFYNNVKLLKIKQKFANEWLRKIKNVKNIVKNAEKKMRNCAKRTTTRLFKSGGCGGTCPC